MTKLQQSKDKLARAKTLDTEIHQLNAQVEDLENCIQHNLCIRLYFNNALNAECNKELSREIMNMALSIKRAQLAEAEKEFNALWRQKRGGQSSE